MRGDDANLIARAVGQRMLEVDNVIQSYGMELEEIRPGYARLCMTVDENMVGPHGVCRGVYTYALGDTACGLAANSWNINTIALGVDAFYLATANRGDRLIAEAKETGSGGRNAIYDVTITDPKGKVVVVLRCHCRVLNGRVIEDLPSLRGPRDVPPDAPQLQPSP